MTPCASARSCTTRRFDSFRNFNCKLERGRRLESGNLRRAAGLCAFDKFGKLSFQWFFALNLNLITHNLAAFAPINFTALILVIEREISVFLKDANLAHAFGTDPARSDVGDATVFKTQTRVGNIFAATQNRHADGIDCLNWRTHEMQNDFQIMDHEIENDADLGAAIGIG